MHPAASSFGLRLGSVSAARRHRARGVFRPLSLALLAALLQAGCGSHSSSSATTGPASAAYGDQFDFLWQTFDQRYSYFVYKNIDWNAMNTTYRPQAVQATSQDQFNQVLIQMLSNLHDLHVHLIDPSGNDIPTFSPGAFINFNQTVWQQYLQSKGTNIVQTGEYTAGYLGGVGYIAIPSWESSSSSQAGDLNQLLQQYQNAPALIIDVRMNGGGDGSTAATFADRFADQNRVGGYDQFRNGAAHTDFGPLMSRPVSPGGPWQYRQPVYLLIGRGCYSSNEDFIAMMRELPNVTVIGDLSGGHSGYPVAFPLSNGWQFTVSTWIDYTAEMQIIEDQGIAPAVAVPVTAADFEAGDDPVLDYAISHLSGL